MTNTSTLGASDVTYEAVFERVGLRLLIPVMAA